MSLLFLEVHSIIDITGAVCRNKEKIFNSFHWSMIYMACVSRNYRYLGKSVKTTSLHSAAAQSFLCKKFNSVPTLDRSIIYWVTQIYFRYFIYSEVVLVIAHSSRCSTMEARVRLPTAVLCTQRSLATCCKVFPRSYCMNASGISCGLFLLTKSIF